MRWREQVRESDREAVRQLVRDTGFFSSDEVNIAVELVDEALRDGKASGYEFLFADAGEQERGIVGYACFGPIPLCNGAYDLYWIAVSPRLQRHGLGKELLREAERRSIEQGAREMYIDTAGRAEYGPTRAFYERMGYSRHDVVQDFYASGDDKVVYRKTLAGVSGKTSTSSS